MEWEEGPIARVTMNFYVNIFSRQPGAIEFHGDAGSLYLGSFFQFDAKVERATFGARYEPVELVRKPFPGCEWSRGVVELGEAMRAGRPHRVTGAQAAHVVELMSAIHTSVRDGCPVDVGSTFVPPEPMDWAGPMS